MFRWVFGGDAYKACTTSGADFHHHLLRAEQFWSGACVQPLSQGSAVLLGQFFWSLDNDDWEWRCLETQAAFSLQIRCLLRSDNGSPPTLNGKEAWHLLQWTPPQRLASTSLLQCFSPKTGLHFPAEASRTQSVNQSPVQWQLQKISRECPCPTCQTTPRLFCRPLCHQSLRTFFAVYQNTYQFKQSTDNANQQNPINRSQRQTSE